MSKTLMGWQQPISKGMGTLKYAKGHTINKRGYKMKSNKLGSAGSNYERVL